MNNDVSIFDENLEKLEALVSDHPKTKCRFCKLVMDESALKASLILVPTFGWLVEQSLGNNHFSRSGALLILYGITVAAFGIFHRHHADTTIRAASLVLDSFNAAIKINSDQLVQVSNIKNAKAAELKNKIENAGLVIKKHRSGMERMKVSLEDWCKDTARLWFKYEFSMIFLGTLVWAYGDLF